MPCLTRTPSRGPFVLARTVVLVSALALLGYLPAANPLTAPSRRERPPGNFALQNCRIRASGLNCRPAPRLGSAASIPDAIASLWMTVVPLPASLWSGAVLPQFEALPFLVRAKRSSELRQPFGLKCFKLRQKHTGHRFKHEHCLYLGFVFYSAPSGAQCILI